MGGAAISTRRYIKPRSDQEVAGPFENWCRLLPASTHLGPYRGRSDLSGLDLATARYVRSGSTTYRGILNQTWGDQHGLEDLIGGLV